MSPEEIIQAYDVLVQEGNNYAAQEAAKVGNSQRSIGGLAEAVANPSGQTSGLANYTYNRLLRPTVDTLAASLTTTGLSQGMDRYLKDQLMAAKNNYENAKNNYTVASTTPKAPNSGTNYREQTDNSFDNTGDRTAEQKEIKRKIQKKTTRQNVSNMQTGATNYYYVQDGMSIPFTVYSGLNGGLEVQGGMSYSANGGRNFINNLRNSGARIYNSFGQDVTNQLIL